MMPGAKARFVHSGFMTLASWDIEAGAGPAEHSHPHEQITHLIEGSLELNVGGKTMLLEAGAIVVIPPHVPHSGKALTSCHLLDIFHPVRVDFQKKQAEFMLTAKGR